MKDASERWSVNLHYADPEDPDSDACATGHDFDTEEEARKCISDLLAGKNDTFNMRYYRDVPYIELDGAKGSDVYEVIRRSAHIKRLQREEAADREMERREYATQCGMAFGVAGYNDAMGYDSEPYDPDIHDTEMDRAKREWERDNARESEEE